jgi:glycosyltransferase involved in cell wall biosynthesis
MEFLQLGTIRVLHLITGTSFGGAQTMLSKLITAIDGAFFESRVISLRPKGPVGDELENAGFVVRYMNASGYLGMVAAIPSLVREVREFRPHVIQGWMYHGNLAATAAARIARSSAPVLWNVRHSLENLGHEKHLTAATIRLGALPSRRVDRVIYNSSSSALQHQAIGYSRNNVVVIPNGFDTVRFRPSNELRAEVRSRFGIGMEEPLVAMVARYHPIKGHDNFLQAAAICARQLPQVRFLLAGSEVDDSNPELLRRVRDLGLKGIVSLFGQRSDVDRLLPALDVLALPSLAEGFPNVLGEAMACGVPCVCTDVGDCASIVGETGRVVPPGRPDVFGQAMVELLVEPRQVREERGIRARERIVQLFSIESVARQYDDLYRSLVQPGAATGA